MELKLVDNFDSYSHKISKNSKKTQKKPKKKKSYRVDMRMPDGTRVSKNFSRKYDADTFRAKLILQKENYLQTGCAVNYDFTVKEYSVKWYDTEVKNRKAFKTQSSYLADIKKYIIPCLGSLKLTNISFTHARKLENLLLSTGKSNRTVNRIMMTFRAIMNDALNANVISKNGVKNYPRLREHKKELSYWSKEEVAKFLTSTKDSPLYNLYLVTLNTGLRLGEVLGLCWDRVNFQSNQLVISRSLSREGLKETTKGHETRYIPMNELVKNALLKERNRGYESNFVFAKADGSPLSYEHLTIRMFRVDVEASECPRIRFHDLRHTFASHFMMNGGNIYTLQHLLGHKDIKTTMIYAHLDKKFLQEASTVVQFS